MMKHGTGLYFQKVERAITLFFYHIGKRRLKNDTSVPILAYHEICDLPDGVNRLHSYNATPASFKEQMDFLHRNHYSVMGLERLISCLARKEPFPERSVVITFDDGYKNNYTNAFPVLKQYDFPATIFLATNYIGSSKVFPWLNGLLSHDEKVKENWMPLSWQEVEEMSRNHITFGSHTSSHSNIRTMNEGHFETEVEKSKETIEKKIGRKVGLFSYPFSLPKYRKRYRDLVENTRTILAKKGFSGACTTIIGTNTLYSDPFCLKRIQIKNSDDLFSFRAKIEGAYNWMGLAQKIYQRLLEPLTELRRNFPRSLSQ